MVFSRFLRHLAYLELPETTEPVPELHWFPAGPAGTAAPGDHAPGDGAPGDSAAGVR